MSELIGGTTQSYNKDSKDYPIGKRILLEFIDFIRYKVENDLLTMREVEGAARLIEEHLPLLGTAEDFAKFYNQPKTNISSVINRRMIQKPIRRVFHSFNAFRKVIPKSWNHR